MHRKRCLSQPPERTNQGDTEGPSEAKIRCVRTERPAGSSLVLRNPLSEVLAGLNNMRKNNVLCDWIVKTNDNKEIPVHSVVLTISSQYFQQLHLESLGSDIRRRVIPLDIPTTVLQEILDYIYTGKCQMDQENFPDILIAANQYKFPEVMQECYNCVMNQLLPENCISIYQFTKEYFTEELSSNLLMYIRHNFRKVLLKNPDILELTIEEVISILSSDELNVADESSLFLFAVRWIEHDMNEREQHVHNLFKCIRFGLMDQTFMRSTVMTNPLVVQNQPIFLEHLNIILPVVRQTFSSEIVFVFGNRIDTKESESTCMDIFDNSASTWFWMTTMSTYNEDEYLYHYICEMSKLVYLIGCLHINKGYFDNNTNRVMCFSPEKKVWEQKPSMHYTRTSMSVVALDGFMYALGGRNNLEDHYFKSVERYDPRSNQWTMIAPMNECRTEASAASLDGRIYVAGGRNMFVNSQTVEAYDPVTDQWTFVQPLTSPRCGHSLVYYQGELYVIGGYISNEDEEDDLEDYSNIVERYKPKNKQPWEPVSSMITPRSNFTAVILDDKIFVICGSYTLTDDELEVIHETEFFDGDSGVWTQGPSLHLDEDRLAACVVSGLQNAKEYSYSTFCARKEEKAKKMGQE